MKKFLAVVLLFGGILFPLRALGLMSSANYTIYADSIDTGGVLSTGGIYSLEDTLGESFAVSTSSINTYEVRAGYQYMEQNYISLDISPATVSLGTLVVSAVNASDATATVSTDAYAGYTLSIDSVTGSSVSAVADGAVTAGAEEYGFAATGGDSLFADDRALTPGLNVASTSTTAVDSQTILTFKASISASTAAGAYSQTISFLAAVN